MLRRAHARRMRGFVPIVIACALLAGCVQSPAAETPTPAPAEATEPVIEVVHLDGVVWLPPNRGQEREETIVELPANASGLAIEAMVVLGSTYGPVPLPATIADVIVQIRDAEGNALAEEHLTAESAEATLEAVTEVAAGHALAFLSYGGSDGSANGDHVDFVVEIKPAS